MLRPTRNILDILKGWQTAGEPYVKVVAPLAWSRNNTPARAIAPAPLHTRDNVRSDAVIGLNSSSKPIYLTVSPETLPLTIDAPSSSSSSSSSSIYLTSLSSTAAAAAGGGGHDNDDAMVMTMISSSSGTHMDEQLKAEELHDLREQLRRVTTRYDVLL